MTGRHGLRVPVSLDFDGVTFAYPQASDPALHDADLRVTEGEVVVVVGASGSGKSTLLQAANGLVPHTTGGRFGGDVRVAARSTRHHRPRDLADVVGYVHQDPEAQFVVDRVEDDIAFVLENLGMGAVAMRRRVEEVLDALGVAHLRGRSPATLSGGERQRCAIAGAMAAAPGTLVLDEPTSQLDPQGADDVMAAVTRLNDDLGVTLLVAEHRLDRAAPLADRAVVLEAARVVRDAPPRAALARRPEAPVVYRLGELFGWDPPPLTVREARRHTRHAVVGPTRTPARPAAGDLLVRLDGARIDVAGRRVLRHVDLALWQGEVVALMGRNGSGKTSLLRTIAGLAPLGRGRLERLARTGYVPQDPNVLLSAATVRRELETTLDLLGLADDGRVDAALGRFDLSGLARRHPRQLSGGQRQRVAIAAVAVGDAPVLLLDEPTRGMDAAAMAGLETALAAHAAAGGAALVATHDVELAARVASRVAILADGDVVADGDPHEVLMGSLFAPQIARVFPPLLTLDDVRRSLLTPDVAPPGSGRSW